jgi:hypothetical protein
MFDLDGVLLSPDRRPTSLGEQVGSRGIVVVGVGKGGNVASRWSIGSTALENNW